MDATNELGFSKAHRFDFIKSQTLGGLKNIKQSNNHSKHEIMARQKNYTALNNYGGSDETLA